ncbi:MAG: hypothetical protein H9791_03465 [Candidatus Bacteroides intestinipullorum]|uniref:Uncharacterized protein n=1 Tax=Candidatus Bacteroides intestinipullorum TaxID=2838471 RepID=A0A9E2KFI2_9BACE|nr:hypothetical protein [Candidatus Bacteroides intestinipullorum]
MTYNDIYNCRNILLNIPLTFEGRRLSKGTAANVMLLRVTYQHKLDEYFKIMQEVESGLKNEGYEERAKEYHQMKEGKTSKYEEKMKAFEAEQTAFLEALDEARKKKADEPVEIKNGKLTKEDLADIYDLIGAEGNFIYREAGTGKELETIREEFLSLIAYNLVG